MLRKPLTVRPGEVRELTRADIREFRPAAEVLPASLVALLPKRKPGHRGAQHAPTKQQITLRLDRDVIASFRSGGRGWQTRMNAVLRDWLLTQPKKRQRAKARAS